ncbi:ABC transporter ATP-binding protein [Varunaivibrio sulfuroxidans]|uniref:Lipopolysaccharide transport system ATP-binding protein n=1 Tax=Varunaivibrio sulfuroxidans TaxID=1773489 RepID=A0A4V2UMW6_9PROT|nr:ABC transporter ATP-binding protein [Varunaivibrio sulfuroxidans]TCS59781.1 lipopolysaccharide transport system ATP-binding protein [Varunaivibrio sulfuroxidans]WES30658.1 ABC transporter ATP-binding protein [Varunaivibrio sulfuroxidans]
MNPDLSISIHNVSKKFRLFSSPKERLYEALHPFRRQYHREFWALNKVSFDVGKGEIVGILGRNGSGKSTLLQIICSVMRPTYGDVQVNGRISALLELGAGFNPEFTGRENVIINGAIMGFSRREMLEKMPKIKAFADIGEFFDQPVKTYSSGMYVRVAFSAAIHVDPEILIVDEALSVGDARFQHRCFQRVRDIMEQGKTILFVSHNTDTLLRICNRGAVLDGGRLCYFGPIADAVNHYAKLLYASTETSPEDVAVESEPLRKSTHDRPSSLTPDVRDAIANNPYYNQHETRLGNNEAQIIDFDIIVDGRINPEEIPAHRSVELIIKIFFHKDIDNISTGFAFVTVDGTYVFGTNFESLERPLFSGRNGKSVAVKFSWKSHFTGGDLFLNVGCHTFVNGEVTFLDVRRSVAKLKFADTPGIAGFVDLEVGTELLQISDAPS